MNKYYEMFINENIDDSILKMNPSSLTFEDHFWHFACMSIYYKNKKDFHMFKKSLLSDCDLNYIYNALLYFEAFNVLPQNYKKYHLQDFLQDILQNHNSRQQAYRHRRYYM